MDLKLSEDGDLVFENGDAVLAKGIDAVRQHLDARFRFIKGESRIDRDVGFPYIQRVFRVGIGDAAIRSIVRRTILTTPGVVSLVRLTVEIDRAARRLRVAFRAKTNFDSPLDFSTEFKIP